MAWANDAHAPDGFALTRPEPGRSPTDPCAWVFFPGCQVCASHPHHVESAYAHLREHTQGGMTDLVAKLGCKNAFVMWPVRIAAAGKAVTPGGAAEICRILGKDETLRRLNIGVEKLSQ